MVETVGGDAAVAGTGEPGWGGRSGLCSCARRGVFGKCGGLSSVDENLLPLGVLRRKVSWQMVL
jgi:hypothetical protein